MVLVAMFYLYWIDTASLLLSLPWVFLCHFLFQELAFILAHVVKRGSQYHLRELILLRYCIHPYVMQLTRWLPLIIFLALILYVKFFVS